MAGILTRGRKACSIMVYMEMYVIPLLDTSNLTWDLTPSGVHAVQSFHSSHHKLFLYFKARYCKYLAYEAQMAGKVILATRYSHKESDLYGECASFLSVANASLTSTISCCYVIPCYPLSTSFSSPFACYSATRKPCHHFSSSHLYQRRNCS